MDRMTLMMTVLLRMGKVIGFSTVSFTHHAPCIAYFLEMLLPVCEREFIHKNKLEPLHLTITKASLKEEIALMDISITVIAKGIAFK